MVGDAGRIWLRTEKLWPKSAEVVPVTDDVALALVSPTSGVVLRLENGSLSYPDYRGEVVRLSRP